MGSLIIANPKKRCPSSLFLVVTGLLRKSTVFQHASGTKSDGSSGDNNCACCTSLSWTAGDSGWGIKVFRAIVPGRVDYNSVCELCWCNTDWLGARSISECAQTCHDQGYSFFQHANGFKPDGSRGDNNCGCCSVGDTNADPTWGVNVYSVQGTTDPQVAAAFATPVSLVLPGVFTLCLAFFA